MSIASDKVEQARKFIPNLRLVTPHLLRGGQPEPGGIKHLKDAGIRTIVCLSGGNGLVGMFRSSRVPSETAEAAQERALAAEAGLNFVSIPLDVFGTVGSEALDQFVELASDESQRPLFIHCLHGRDRTGLMTAVYRVVVDGWSADRAYAEMLDCGFDMSRTNLSDALFALAKRRAAAEGAGR